MASTTLAAHTRQNQMSKEYEPVTKCLCTNTWISYVKSKGWSTEGLYTGISFDERYMCDVENWMPSSQVYRLAKNITTVLNLKPDEFYRMALWAAENRTAGTILSIAKSFLNPGFVYDKMPKYIQNFNKHRKVTLASRAKTQAVLNIYHMTDVKAIPEVCEWTRGLLAAAPIVLGLPPANVRESKCELKGHECCQYEVSWTNRKRFLPMFWDKTFGRARLIEEQRIELEKNQERLRERFDELSQAKAEIEVYARTLEVKVEERTQELRIAQAQLIEKERLITESHIAGGMAHEIRNALGAAKLRLDSLSSTNKIQESQGKLMAILNTIKQQSGLSEDSVREVVQAIRVLHDNQKLFEKTFQEVGLSTERGLQITNRVMEYSRLHMDKADEAIDVKAIFAELESTYRDSLNQKGITLELNLQNGLVVRGSNSRLHSVFQNLLLNARDAILEKGEGQGIINVRSNIQEGWANVEIEDTGVGIPSESLERIFYPFYSTKPSTGMGLGLSECQKIVRQYNGKIQVQSATGIGSIFKVTLPQGPIP
jgi:signal transduction histidine kinase